MEIGVDIVKVEKMRKVISNKKVLNRIFDEEEIKYCLQKRDPAISFAARFAAKESVFKLLNNKITGLSFKDIIIRPDKNNKPNVYLPERFKNINEKLSISLSHTNDTAIAVAILND